MQMKRISYKLNEPVHSTNYSTHVPTRIHDFFSVSLLNGLQLNYVFTESERERKRKKIET